MSDWLWNLAERMDWNEARPRWLWRAILRRLDWKHGYELDYD